MFLELSNELVIPVLLLVSLVVVLLWRRWGLLFMEWIDMDDSLPRSALYKVPTKQLNIPFHVNLSQSSKELKIVSQATGWTIYTYKDISIASVLSNILGNCESDEEYQRLLRQCNGGEHYVKEYSGADTHTISLDVGEREVQTNEQRTTYPLVIAATDSKSTLVCLVHVADKVVPTSYIIAQFYRESTGTFYRLTNLYTSSSNAEEDECSVCLSNAASCFLLPCRHKCSCPQCTQRLVFCPVCRAHIGSYIDTHSVPPSPEQAG